MEKIKVGTDCYLPLEEAKACNFCKHFVGIGLHAFSCFCTKFDKEIVDCYTGSYRKVAKTCDEFVCKPELLIND